MIRRIWGYKQNRQLELHARTNTTWLKGYKKSRRRYVNWNIQKISNMIGIDIWFRRHGWFFGIMKIENIGSRQERIPGKDTL